MSGYEVVIAAIRKAADAARSAGEQAGAVDLAGTVAPVPNALKGSRSAASAANLAGTWRTVIKDWSNAATGLGDKMSKAADLYEKNEQAAKDELTPTGYGNRPS